LIFQYRRFLEAALLIEELRPGFDAIEKLFALTQPWAEPPIPDPPNPKQFPLVLFDFEFHTYGQTGHCEAKGFVGKDSNPQSKLLGAGGSETLAEPDLFKNVDFTVIGQGVPVGGSVLWEDAVFILLNFRATKDSKGNVDDATFTISVKATDD
jgi:hypothetical protein